VIIPARTAAETFEARLQADCTQEGLDENMKLSWLMVILPWGEVSLLFQYLSLLISWLIAFG
jgi:hypothetical protein